MRLKLNCKHLVLTKKFKNMKKTFLAAMALIVAFAFTSCDKPVTPTNTDLLTQKSGWVLTSATSEPAFVPIEGDPSKDLFKSFFFDCEIDDINYFKLENKEHTLNAGKDGKTYDLEAEDCAKSTKDITLGKWKFINDKETVLQFYLAAYYDEKTGNYEALEAEIVTLDANTLQLSVPIYEYTKSLEPQYHFTLTYTKAK